MNSANIKCPECPYDKARNLGTHLFFVHGYSKNKIAEWRMNVRADTLSRARDYEIFRCQFCPKTYRRQNSCRAHERTVHCVTFNSRQKCVPCPVRGCQFTTTALLDLCAHAKESHSNLGDFTIREARFENMELFTAWRAQYEEQTATVLATESVNSNAAAGTTLRYLRCAQLEAQIRKARNQVRLAQERNNQGIVEEPESEEFEEEQEGREEEAREEEEKPPQPGRSRSYNLEGTGGHNLRSVRKRKADEVEVREEQRYMMKREKVVKREDEDDEEEEIDVEQLDEEEATVSKKPAASPSKRVKVKARAPPRLQRASSAHLDPSGAGHSDDDNDEEEEDEGEGMPAELEMERRMNSRHCTAHMRVCVLRGGEVHVEYCVSHLGHDVIPIPPTRGAAAASNRPERATKAIKPLSVIKQKEAEEAIERAKARRKGRRETEHRWRTERRLRTERDEFEQLCDRYDDIAANVELYETVDDSGDAYDEDELPVEEVIEAEEEVDHEELVEADE